MANSATQTAPASPEVADLRALEAKIDAMLPPQYQHCANVRTSSMGTAGLKYGRDGKVAWDEIWTSFCDLAVAGGPPHRGKWLAPVSVEEARSNPEQYQQVVEEIARGIWLVNQIPVLPRLAPGWVGVVCQNDAMAAWLLRAVIAENVCARRERHILHVPAGPHFELAKEIKNVVTVLAKTCHYWSCHMDAGQQAKESADPALGPALPTEIAADPSAYQAVVDEIAAGVQTSVELTVKSDAYPGWVGVNCNDVDTAVWLLRAVLVRNVLARREENILYLPAHPAFHLTDRTQVVVAALADAVRLRRVQLTNARRSC